MLPASTNVENEFTNDSLPSRRVRNLWVELNTIERLGIMRQSGIWGCGRMSNDMKIRGWLR